MKSSVSAVLLLWGLLAFRANAQDAISSTIDQIASTNPAALIDMGGQPLSEANFQALARAVGNVFNTLQILTLPYISSQFSTQTAGIQNLNVLVNALNSSLVRLNSTLNTQINASNSSTVSTFQQVNSQIARLNNSVAQLTAYNCCTTVSSMNTQLTTLISRYNLEQSAINSSIASLNSTVRITNMTSLTNFNTVRASVASLDTKVTAVIGNVSNVNVTLNAKIDALNSSFTQNLTGGQTPDYALFTYYNQTLGRLEANVSNLTNTTGHLIGLEAVVSNISDYLVNETTEENVKFGALNTSVLGLNETLNSLLTNVSSMNGTVNNLVGNISNLSQQIQGGMAALSAVNATLQGVAANLTLVNDSIIRSNSTSTNGSFDATSINNSLNTLFSAVESIKTNLSFAVYNKPMGDSKFNIFKTTIETGFGSPGQVLNFPVNFNGAFTNKPTVVVSTDCHFDSQTNFIDVQVAIKSASSATVVVSVPINLMVFPGMFTINLIAYGN